MDGSVWQLVTFNGTTVPDTRPPVATMVFGHNGSLGGTAACNEGGSPIRWGQGRFALQPDTGISPAPAFTVMRCLDDASSELGYRFWQRMMHAQTWFQDGQTLTIRFADGSSASLRRSAPPAAAGAQFPAPGRLATPGVGSTEGLTERHLAAMFSHALAQAAPIPEVNTICVGLQGVQDREMRDAPANVVAQLASTLGLTAVPASDCSMDTVPRRASTREQAVLYTVNVERIGEPITFLATATFGNLGANGTQYRLRTIRGGALVAEPTGLKILS